MSKDLALQRKHLAMADVPTAIGPASTSYLTHEPTLPAGTAPALNRSSRRRLVRTIRQGRRFRPRRPRFRPRRRCEVAPNRQRTSPRVLMAGAVLALVALLGGVFWLSRQEEVPARQATVDAPRAADPFGTAGFNGVAATETASPAPRRRPLRRPRPAVRHRRQSMRKRSRTRASDDARQDRGPPGRGPRATLAVVRRGARPLNVTDCAPIKGSGWPTPPPSSTRPPDSFEAPSWPRRGVPERLRRRRRPRAESPQRRPSAPPLAAPPAGHSSVAAPSLGIASAGDASLTTT